MAVMPALRALIATVLVLIAAIPLFAADASVQSREDVVYSAKDWNELYQAYKSLRRKADGVVAGAFVDKISSLLDERWDRLAELQRIVTRDQRFHQFVINQLNEAVPADTAKRIKNSADNNCPSGASQLCKEISDRFAK